MPQTSESSWGLLMLLTVFLTVIFIVCVNLFLAPGANYQSLSVLLHKYF